MFHILELLKVVALAKPRIHCWFTCLHLFQCDLRSLSCFGLQQAVITQEHGNILEVCVGLAYRVAQYPCEVRCQMSDVQASSNKVSCKFLAATKWPPPPLLVTITVISLKRSLMTPASSLTSLSVFIWKSASCNLPRNMIKLVSDTSRKGQWVKLDSAGVFGVSWWTCSDSFCRWESNYIPRQAWRLVTHKPFSWGIDKLKTKRNKVQSICKFCFGREDDVLRILRSDLVGSCSFFPSHLHSFTVSSTQSLCDIKRGWQSPWRHSSPCASSCFSWAKHGICLSTFLASKKVHRKT